MSASIDCAFAQSLPVRNAVDLPTRLDCRYTTPFDVVASAYWLPDSCCHPDTSRASKSFAIAGGATSGTGNSKKLTEVPPNMPIPDTTARLPLTSMYAGVSEV